MGAYTLLSKFYLYGNGVEKDINKAISLLIYASERNEAEAQSVLGRCYLYGKGVEKDKTLAISLLKKASKQNIRIANRTLGECYQKGIGVERDIPTAIQYYTKAGLLEDKKAIIALIEIFEKEDYKDLFGDEQFDVFVKGVQLDIQDISRITATWSNREPTKIMDGDVVYASQGLRLINTTGHYE